MKKCVPIFAVLFVLALGGQGRTAGWDENEDSYAQRIQIQDSRNPLTFEDFVPPEEHVALYNQMVDIYGRLSNADTQEEVDQIATQFLSCVNHPSFSTLIKVPTGLAERVESSPGGDPDLDPEELEELIFKLRASQLYGEIVGDLNSVR